MESIFVYGAGGHGKVVIDALHSGPHPVVVKPVVDDNPRLHGKALMGHRIVSPRELGPERGFIAIGDNAGRQRIAALYRGRLIVIVHPAAILARDVRVGEGTILMAGSIVNAGSVIGENVIINTSASVDHDCVIEAGVHIAPGCRLCGNVQVGKGSLLGAGTVVIPGIRIGTGAFVHAGQVVTADVADGETVRGPRPHVPSRPRHRDAEPPDLSPDSLPTSRSSEALSPSTYSAT